MHQILRNAIGKDFKFLRTLLIAYVLIPSPLRRNFPHLLVPSVHIYIILLSRRLLLILQLKHWWHQAQGIQYAPGPQMPVLDILNVIIVIMIIKYIENILLSTVE